MYTYWNGFYEISLTDGSSRLIDNVWGIVSADKDYIYVVDSEINRYVIDDYKSCSCCVFYSHIIFIRIFLLTG